MRVRVGGEGAGVGVTVRAGVRVGRVGAKVSVGESWLG